MESTLDNIKYQILHELESKGAIDIARWARTYPQHRDELLDFAYWAELSAEIPDQEEGEEWEDSDQVAQSALRSWCAVLQQESRAARKGHKASNSTTKEQSDSEGKNPRGEKRPSGRRHSAPDAFKRAAVLAWSVQCISGSVQRVTRLRLNKSLLLLERRMGLGLFTKHQKMLLGPYDPSLRYKDGEPIAKGKGWITVEGTAIRPGTNIQQGCSFAPGYIGDERLAEEFLRVVSSFSESELETLTTVDAVVLELLNEQSVVTVETVKQALQRTGEWQGKLKKRNFSDLAISTALTQLRQLQLQ